MGTQVVDDGSEQLSEALHSSLGGINQLVRVPSGENCVFRAESDRWGSIALRLSPTARRSRAEVVAEIGLVRQLHGAGAPVVAALIDDVLPEPVDWAGATWWPVSFPWIHGLAPDLSEATVRSWGATLGQIHVAASAIEPVGGRCHWASSGHFAVDQHLGGWPEDERVQMQALLAELAGVPASAACHGDLGLANLVWAGGRPLAIDFDDCCIGPRALDVAAAVTDLVIDNRSLLQMDPRQAFGSFLRGYLDAASEFYEQAGFLLDAFLWVTLIERCVTVRRTGIPDPAADARLKEALRTGRLPPEFDPGRRSWSDVFAGGRLRVPVGGSIGQPAVGSGGAA